MTMYGIGVPRSRWVWVPCPAYLIRHPSAGEVLVDTGLHPSVATKPGANMGRALARWARPRLEPGADVPARLRALGLDAKRIATVVMTHLQFDHASAISEFENAVFVLSEAEWRAATTDPRPLFRGYRPAQFDFVFDYRTVSYDAPEISSYGSFGRTFDLFGDGSIHLAFTPGHSAGHMSVVCRLAEHDFVIAGDTMYTLSQLDGSEPAPPRPQDAHNFRRSLQEMRLFRNQFPGAVIAPSHDPDFYAGIKQRYE
jgi:N-acyl homoserine lactone hydrolase